MNKRIISIIYELCGTQAEIFEGKRNIQKAGVGSSRQYSYSISIL